MQQQYADLELSLHRFEAGVYTVEFRFSMPDSEADAGLGQGNPVRVAIDPTSEVFGRPMTDAHEYGQALSAALFDNVQLRSAFDRARAAATDKDFPLRFRLWIGASAPELYSLRWETLLDPQDGTPLATNENFLFSRYHSSSDWRPVRLRPKSSLRAVVAVANPSDLENYKLAPVKVDEELEQARKALDKITLTILPETERHATINAIIDALRTDESDILYLVCHGVFVKDEPILYLEGEDGKHAAISGGEFSERIKQLPRQPRLAVLVSCQSAGKGQGNVLSALGPRLVEAGIPAVMAMQDNFTMETARQFMPIFFRELQKDGQIDRALAVARSMVQSRPDQWVPVLYMRLKSGRLWYTPGRSIDGKQFGKFPAVVQNIRKGRATPIIGPGLVEPLFSSLREVAWEWARKFQYPMAPHERESLPQVAQYLFTSLAPAFPYDELKDYLRQHIRTIYAEDLPVEMLGGDQPLEVLIDEIGKSQRQKNPLDPHHILAQFNLPVYFTANADTLLETALKEDDPEKEPQSLLCPWNSDVKPPSLETPPDLKHPVVFHFFGRWDQDKSLVLTEDQYFAFLIGVTRNFSLIPASVREALTKAGLLFLGFQTDEWAFRILFQTILAQEGRAIRANYAQVAAQVEPDDERLLQPSYALKYLEKYFEKDADIEIYWGSPREFLSELARQIKSQ
jgi:hypothetical protein